jgi:type VI protein secretion system component VasF
MPIESDKPSSIIHSLGEAGGKAGTPFWSLVLLACLIGALVFLFWQQNKDSSVRSSERQEMISRLLDSQEKRIEQLTGDLLSNAPDAVNQAERIEYQARQQSIEDAVLLLQEIQKELLEEVRKMRQDRLPRDSGKLNSPSTAWVARYVSSQRIQKRTG